MSLKLLLKALFRLVYNWLPPFKENELQIIQLMKEKVREVHEDDVFSSLQSTSMLQPSTVSLQRRHMSLIFDVSVAVSYRVMNIYFIQSLLLVLLI